MGFRPLNRVRMTVSGTPGTGTVTLGTNVAGFLSIAGAGGLDGNQVRYVYEDGNDFEVGYGTYTASGTTLTRNLIISSTGSLLSLSSTAEVSVTLIAEDMFGKQSIWIPAAAMAARLTNGPSAGTVEMSTNKNMFATLDFDTTTQEFAQFAIRMPESWNEGTISFIPVWSHASTTTNFGVAWGLAGIAISDNEAGDAAFGTAQTSVDTGGTTNNVYQGPESSAITIAGSPAAGDYVMLQINRTVADGGDTMAIDARLHGILVLYTTDALKDG